MGGILSKIFGRRKSSDQEKLLAAEDCSKVPQSTTAAEQPAAHDVQDFSNPVARSMTPSATREPSATQDSNATQKPTQRASTTEGAVGGDHQTAPVAQAPLTNSVQVGSTVTFKGQLGVVQGVRPSPTQMLLVVAFYTTQEHANGSGEQPASTQHSAPRVVAGPDTNAVAATNTAGATGTCPVAATTPTSENQPELGPARVVPLQSVRLVAVSSPKKGNETVPKKGTAASARGPTS